LVAKPFLNYEIVTVVGPEHPLAGRSVTALALRGQNWCLGPAAAGADGVVQATLKRIGVPESRQRIFQSEAAALEETKRTQGITLAVQFSVGADLKAGRLVRIDGPELRARGTAGELMRFITTPRATQAMLRGSGAPIGRFRPAVYVTLWS